MVIYTKTIVLPNAITVELIVALPLKRRDGQSWSPEIVEVHGRERIDQQHFFNHCKHLTIRTLTIHKRLANTKFIT